MKVTQTCRSSCCFCIQSQFLCVVLVSGTNLTKVRLKRRKGRDTVLPVASQRKDCGSDSSSGFSADTPVSSRPKTNTWNFLVGKYQKEGGEGGGGIYSSLNLTQQTPVMTKLHSFVFYHTALICVITTSAATTAAFEVQCYYKQPQRGRQKRCVCVCALLKK